MGRVFSLRRGFRRNCVNSLPFHRIMQLKLLSMGLFLLLTTGALPEGLKSLPLPLKQSAVSSLRSTVIGALNRIEMGRSCGAIPPALSIRLDRLSTIRIVGLCRNSIEAIVMSSLPLNRLLILTLVKGLEVISLLRRGDGVVGVGRPGSLTVLAGRAILVVGRVEELYLVMTRGMVIVVVTRDKCSDVESDMVYSISGVSCVYDDMASIVVAFDAADDTEPLSEAGGVSGV